MRRLPLLVLCIFFMVACTPEAHTATNKGTTSANTERVAMVQQIIVKPKGTQVVDTDGNLLPQFIDQLEQEINTQLSYVRPMSGGAHVLRFVSPMPVAQTKQIFSYWQQQDLVEYAEADGIMQIANPAKP